MDKKLEEEICFELDDIFNRVSTKNEYENSCYDLMTMWISEDDDEYSTFENDYCELVEETSRLMFDKSGNKKTN
jgi:hypothetical protein